MEIVTHVLHNEEQLRSYIGSLKMYNKTLQEDLARSLQALLSSDNPHYAVFTTGSDGRQEKCPVSRLEFVVITDGQFSPDQLDFVQYGLKHFRPTLTDEEIEVKVIGTDVMSQFQNIPDRTFPMRITDLAYLGGNRLLKDAAKIAMVREWQGSSGRSILERLRRRKGEYKRITESGGEQVYQGRNLRHFDLEAGMAYYERDSGILSFKLGPLRWIQSEITQGLMVYYRSRPKPEEDRLILSLPKAISERLLFLEDSKLTVADYSGIRELSDCYNFFLWLYNTSQEVSYNHGQTVIGFDQKQVKERLGIVRKILSNPLLKI